MGGREMNEWIPIKCTLHLLRVDKEQSLTLVECEDSSEELHESVTEMLSEFIGLD